MYITCKVSDARSSSCIYIDIVYRRRMVKIPISTYISITPISYTILAAAVSKSESDPKKASAGILSTIQLDNELYRLGHNKAC